MKGEETLFLLAAVSPCKEASGLVEWVQRIIERPSRLSEEEEVWVQDYGLSF